MQHGACAGVALMDPRVNVKRDGPNLAIAADRLAFDIADNEIARCRLTEVHPAAINQILIIAARQRNTQMISKIFVPVVSRTYPKHGCEVAPKLGLEVVSLGLV
jgi:hypothetical protein